MKEETLNLYDDNFNKLNKTIVRRKNEIPNGANIMSKDMYQKREVRKNKKETQNHS